MVHTFTLEYLHDEVNSLTSALLCFFKQIYHCNINSSGRICHSILDRHYIPSLTMRQIIDYIYGLLLSPEPSDLLDRYVK